MFKDTFEKKKLDAILISSWANIAYLTKYSNFSKEEREAFIIITPNQKYLITDKRYTSEVIKLAKGFKIIEEGVSYFLKVSFKKFCKENKISIVGFEEDNFTVLEHRILKKTSKATPLLFSRLREIKKDWEIENIKKACRICDNAFEFILKKIRVGVTEKEIALELENFIKEKAQDISFKPIVAFGKNSAVPHHQADSTKLIKNQIVLLDFGAIVNNYCSDMTRTVFFGKATKEQAAIYETVKKAQELSIEFLKSSFLKKKKVKGKEVDSIARKYIEKNYSNRFIHSLGHGVGIEVHESPHISPTSDQTLTEGMVFSIEPGIYIDNFGGVRIEDLVMLGKNGPELISHANRRIIEI